MKKNKRIICALALVDLYFDEKTVRPVYKFKKAMELCAQSDPLDCPCKIKPPKGYSIPK